MYEIRAEQTKEIFLGEATRTLFPRNERQEHRFVGRFPARPSDRSSMNISSTLGLKDSIPISQKHTSSPLRP